MERGCGGTAGFPLTRFTFTGVTPSKHLLEKMPHKAPSSSHGGRGTGLGRLWGWRQRRLQEDYASPGHLRSHAFIHDHEVVASHHSLLSKTTTSKRHTKHMFHDKNTFPFKNVNRKYRAASLTQ